MSRPSSLGPLRAVLLYTAFDLKNLPAYRYLLWFAMPLLVLGSLTISLGSSTVAVDALVGNHIVILADPSLHADLESWFDGSTDEIELLATREASDPAVAERGMNVLAVLSDDFAQDGRAKVTTAPGTSELHGRRLRKSLDAFLVDRWVTASAGPAPELLVQRPDGTVLNDREESVAQAMDETPDTTGTFALQGIGAFVIGVFGLGFGMMVGIQVSLSGREGFNSVLSVGTSKRMIYSSEMLTGAIMAGGQGFAWMVVYAALAIFVGSTSFGIDQSLSEVAFLTPIVIVLASLAVVQGCGIGCVLHRLSEELPRGVRERGGQLLSFVLIAGIVLLDDSLLNPTLLFGLSMVPAFGTCAIWFHHIEGGDWVPVLVAAQGLYTLASVELGTRVFMLGEPPISYLKRRFSNP